MPIVGIQGPIGSGKTTCLTYFALQEALVLKKPIYANYHFTELPSTYMTFDDLMMRMESKFDFMRAGIFLTEAHIWLDSRMSASKLSRLMTYFVLQTGKQDINLYYDTQDFGQVDIRLRRMTDIAIHIVKKQGNLHKIKIKDMHTGKTRNGVINGASIYPHFNTREIAQTGRTTA